MLSCFVYSFGLRGRLDTVNVGDASGRCTRLVGGPKDRGHVEDAEALDLGAVCACRRQTGWSVHSLDAYYREQTCRVRIEDVLAGQDLEVVFVGQHFQDRICSAFVGSLEMGLHSSFEKGHIFHLAMKECDLWGEDASVLREILQHGG